MTGVETGASFCRLKPTNCGSPTDTGDLAPETCPQHPLQSLCCLPSGAGNFCFFWQQPVVDMGAGREQSTRHWIDSANPTVACKISATVQKIAIQVLRDHMLYSIMTFISPALVPEAPPPFRTDSPPVVPKQHFPSVRQVHTRGSSAHFSAKRPRIRQILAR